MLGMKPLDRAIELLGGQTEFSKRMSVSVQVVTNWKARGVPLDRVADIERITLGAVKRADFYPEHFGPIASTRTAA